MKLLVVGDIHAEIGFLSRILLHASHLELDAVVLVGDIGTDLLFTRDAEHPELRQRFYRGSVAAAFDVLACLGAPVYYVLGNRDLPSAATDREGFHNIDILAGGGHADVDGWSLFGIGGSNYDPEEDSYRPKWHHEWREEEADGKAKAYLNREGAKVDLGRLVLVSHDAPWHTMLDRSRMGQPLGSQTVRDLAAAWEPCLLLCGHIHESPGVDLLGRRTLAVNAGALVLPSVTYATALPPRYTSVSVAFEDHFYVVELLPAPGSTRVDHYTVKLAQGDEVVVLETFSIRDGQLCVESGGRARPQPCSGSRAFPDKDKVREQMRQLRAQRRGRPHEGEMSGDDHLQEDPLGLGADTTWNGTC